MSPGGEGCQLALEGKRAILRSSPGNLYLIMQLHTPLTSSLTQYIRLFGVVVSILQQSKPMPGIHGRLTCFKQRLMKDVMPLVVRCACSYMLNLIIVQGELLQMNMKGGMIILLCAFSLQLRLYIRELLPELLNPYCPHYGEALGMLWVSMMKKRKNLSLKHVRYVPFLYSCWFLIVFYQKSLNLMTKQCHVV